MYDGLLRNLFSIIQRSDGEYRDEDTNTLSEGQTNGECLDAVRDYGYDLCAVLCGFQQGAPNGGQGMDGRIATNGYHAGGALLDPVKYANYAEGFAEACAVRGIIPWAVQIHNEEYKLDADDYPAYVECIEAVQEVWPFTGHHWFIGSSTGSNGGLAEWMLQGGHLDRLNLKVDTHFNGEEIDDIVDEGQFMNSRGYQWACLEDRQVEGEPHNDAVNRCAAVINSGGIAWVGFGQRNENWHDATAPCVWGTHAPRKPRQEVGIFSCGHSVEEQNWSRYKEAVNEYSYIGKKPGDELPMVEGAPPPNGYVPHPKILKAEEHQNAARDMPRPSDASSEWETYLDAKLVEIGKAQRQLINYGKLPPESRT